MEMSAPRSPKTLSTRRVLGATLGSTGLALSLIVACQSNKQGPNAPVVHGKGSLDGNLQRLGFRLPPDLTSGPLMVGMVLDLSTGAVVCTPERMLPAGAVQEVPAANSQAAEIADSTFGVGSNYYRLIASAGVQLRGNVVVSNAIHSQVAGALARPVDPGCDAAAAKLQDEGKTVAVITQAVRADLAFTLNTPQPLDGGSQMRVAGVLGGTLSGQNAGGFSVTSPARVIGYKTTDLPNPIPCVSEAPCTQTRRVDGVCRCVRCDSSVADWANASGYTDLGGSGRVRFEQGKGFDVLCKNMPEDKIEVVAQGSVLTAITEAECPGDPLWEGCLELVDQPMGAVIGQVCHGPPRTDLEQRVLLTPSTKGLIRRDANSGDVHVAVRNRGTSRCTVNAGPIYMRGFNVTVRAPSYSR